MAGIALTAAPSPLRAQAPDQIGSAITAACGSMPDPSTEAVLAGTVRDSISGVALPRARVLLTWHGGGGGGPGQAMALTDSRGFFAFCKVPGGIRARLSATLRVSSDTLLVPVEAGMLHMEHILLSLSDPQKPGILMGRVIEAGTRKPLDGAMVRIEELKAQTLTNSRGYFSFGKQPWGVYTLDVEDLGYATLSTPVRVAGNLTQNAEIQMSQAALPIPGLTVSVRPRQARVDIDGLVRRMNMGFGNFVTREAFEKRPSGRVSDFLQEIPGIWVIRDGSRATLEVRGKPCRPDIFLDGVPYVWDPATGVDFVPSQGLEAIEVYRGAAQIPGEFIRPGRLGIPCAVIALWSRIGG